MFIANEIKEIFTRIKESKNELSKTRSLAGVALLMTLNVIVGMFPIELGPNLQIGFSSVFAGATGMIYGPIPAAVAGVVADHIKFLIHPTGPYFIGFPINEFLVGFIYGCLFYKQKVTLPRTVFARLLITVFINLCLTSLWLNILYQSPLFTSIRFVKNVVMFPIDAAILYFVLRIFERVYHRIRH